VTEIFHGSVVAQTVRWVNYPLVANFL